MSRRKRPPRDKGGPDPRLDLIEADKVELSAANGVRQFREVVRLVERAAGNLALSPDLICRLHRLAVEGIEPGAGRYRTIPVAIRGSKHKPPGSGTVAGLVEDMCRRANEEADWEPVETAAYLLWRLNWIHPFADGNGRTSRAVAYLALCVRLGVVLPGRITIPELIVADRGRYQRALEDADAAWSEGVLDIGLMRELLEELLVLQLGSRDSAPDAPEE